MSEPVGMMFCLDCMYKHSRDLEHHLEDAVRVTKGSERMSFEDMIDTIRKMRSQILDKMKGSNPSSTCLSCGSNPRKYLPHGLTSYEKKCKSYQHRLARCIKKVERKEDDVESAVAVCRASVKLHPC